MAQRVELDRVVDVFNGAIIFLLANVRVATDGVSCRVTRKQLDRLVEIFDGPVIIVDAAISLPPSEEGHGRPRIDRRRLTEVLQGAFELAGLQSRHAPGIVVTGIFRIEADGTVVLLDRAFKISCDRVEYGGPDEHPTFIHPRLANFRILSLEGRQPGGRAAGRDDHLR